MRPLLITLLVHAASGGTLPDLPPRPVVSESHAFLVHDARYLAAKPLPPSRLQERDWVRLEPETLAIAAERIRERLYSVLRLPRRHFESTDLVLCATQEVNPSLVCSATRYADGWRYRLVVPDHVAPLKLVRAVIQLSLLELANRGAGAKSAEIPIWLTEGLTGHLISLVGPELVPPAPPLGTPSGTTRQLQGADPVGDARARLRANPPLTYFDLTSPSSGLLRGPSEQVYRDSAHLFVYELLRVPDGPVRLLGMVRRLPYCWNWQVAFLEAFQPHFERILDVEKWWSLTFVEFTGSGARDTGGREFSLRRLDEVLTSAVWVRRRADALPARVEVSLQEIIAYWAYSDQLAILPQKIVQLRALELRSSTEVAPIIRAYEDVLESYLERRTQAEHEPNAKRQVPGLGRIVAREAVQTLDALDLRRRALKDGPVSTLSESSRIP